MKASKGNQQSSLHKKEGTKSRISEKSSSSSKQTNNKTKTNKKDDNNQSALDFLGDVDSPKLETLDVVFSDDGYRGWEARDDYDLDKLREIVIPGYKMGDFIYTHTFLGNTSSNMTRKASVQTIQPTSATKGPGRAMFGKRVIPPDFKQVVDSLDCDYEKIISKSVIIRKEPNRTLVEFPKNDLIVKKTDYEEYSVEKPYPQEALLSNAPRFIRDFVQFFTRRTFVVTRKNQELGQGYEYASFNRAMRLPEFDLTRNSKTGDSSDGLDPESAMTIIADHKNARAWGYSRPKIFDIFPAPDFLKNLDMTNKISTLDSGIGKWDSCKNDEELTFGEGKMFNFMVKPGNIHFSAANYEPFFGTLFVYDKVNKVRVSENFSFLMNSEGKGYSEALQTKLSKLCESSDTKTTCKQVIFQVDQPSSDYLLILRVDKVLQANTKKFNKIYEKEQIKSNKINRAINSYDFFVGRTFDYRQVLCWSVAPIFTSDGEFIDNDGQEFRTFWKHNPADHDILNTLVQCSSGVSKKLTTLYARCPFSMTMIKELSSVHEKLSPSGVLLKPSKIKLPKQQASSSSSSSSSAIVQPIPYGTCTQIAYHFSSSNNAGTGPSGFYEQYFNDLYIYPESAVFARKSLINKVRNISISIGLERVDDSGETEKLCAMYMGTHSRELLSKKRCSTCAWHEKMPVFQDEFKLRLPIAPSPRHFIVFEFNQVSVGNTHTAGAKRLVGISLLPLCTGKSGAQQFLPSLTVDLPILHQRPKSFYAKPAPNEYWNKGRPCFRVSFSLASTVLTRDRTLWKFANALDSITETPEFARQSLRALGETADFSALALRVPVILGEIAWIMCNVPQLSAEAFSAMLRVLDLLRTHQRAAVIAHYIRFIFVNPPLERRKGRAFFEVLTARWVELLSGSNDNDNTVSISIRLAEHLFALIHKSMALYLDSTQPTTTTTSSSTTKNNASGPTTQPDRHNAFSSHFVASLRNLVTLFRWDVEVCWGADFASKVATFLAGLLSLMDRGIVMDIAKRFIFSLQPYDDTSVIRCKFAAAGAIARHEHYVQLNLPTTEPLPDGVKSYMPRANRPTITKDNSKMLKRNDKQMQLKTGFWAYLTRKPQHFLADSILDLVECYLGDKFSQDIALQAARTLRDVFIRHDTDSRYNTDPAAMAAIARMYIPYLEILIKQPRLTTYSPECRRTLYSCLLWLLKNLNKNDITAWARHVTNSEFTAYFSHLKSCVQAFTIDGAVSAAAAAVTAVGDVSTISTLKRVDKGKGKALKDSWPFKASAQHDICLHTEAYITVLENLEQLVDLYGPKELINGGAKTTHARYREDEDEEDEEDEDEDIIIEGGDDKENIDTFVRDVFSVYLEIMGSGATKQIVVRLYSSLSCFVEMFSKQFFLRRTPYVGQMCKIAVKHCNNRDEAVRTVAATFLYKLMKLNTAATGKKKNFSRVKVQSTIGVSELVSANSDNIQCFISSLRLIMHYNFQENASMVTKDKYDRHLAKKDARARKREGKKKIAELKRIKSRMFNSEKSRISAAAASAISASPASSPNGMRRVGKNQGIKSALNISSSIRIEFDQGNNDDIEIVPEVPSGTPPHVAEEVCENCQCVVVVDDRVEVDGKVYHQNCFRCAHCNCKLNFETCMPFEDRYYCSDHYNLLFKSFIENNNNNNNNSMSTIKRRLSVSRRERPGPIAIGGSCAVTNEYVIYNRFGEDVQDLVKRLMRIISDSSMMNKYKSDPEMLRDLYWRIAKSYVNTPTLRFTWLNNLKSYNESTGYPIEAAECLCHMAAFAAEYLHLVCGTRDGKPWMPAGYRSFADISPNIALDESFLEDSMPDSESATDMQEFTEDGLIQLLVTAAESLVHAQLYEVAHQVYKLVLTYREHFKSYDMVADLFGKLERIYKELITANTCETRFLGVYYRVGLYGEAFEEANGREFVYRENGLATLSDICNRLVTQYTNRFKGQIKGEVKIIQASDKVDPALKDDLNNAYIQVTHVDPYFEDPEIINSDFVIDRSLGIDTFYYSKVFTQDGSKTEDKARLFKRKTILHTERSFPYVKNRLIVVHREEIILTPIEAAIEDLEDKTREISKVLRAPTVDPKRLTPLLQGVCLVMVGVGPAEGICKAFFDPAVVKKWRPQDLLKLQDTFQDFLVTVHDGLAKHEHIIDPSMRPMHDEMMNGFAKLQVTVMKMISGASNYTRTASAEAPSVKARLSSAEKTVMIERTCPLADAIEAPANFNVVLKSNVPVLCPSNTLKRKQSKVIRGSFGTSSASSTVTSLDPMSKESREEEDEEDDDGKDEMEESGKDDFQNELDIISDINMSMNAGSALALSRIGSMGSGMRKIVSPRSKAKGAKKPPKGKK